MNDTGNLYEITAYTENQVGLLSAIAGIFTRRSLNIEKLMVYPSQIQGIHKFRIKTRATEHQIQQVVQQIEKKVDVIRAFWEVDDRRTEREIQMVSAFLNERDNINKNN